MAPWGVYVSTPKVSEQEAEVQIATRVENRLMMGSGASGADAGDCGPGWQSHREVCHVRDDQWSGVGREHLDLVQKITVDRACCCGRWRSRLLYTVRTRLVVNGQPMDAVETPFGIRRIEYDVDKGFLLNGQHVKMLGECLHQDGGAFGVAVPEGVWERRLKLLKAMGCNAIRCSHNPPAPEFLDLCDRLGFLVMDEAFDEWTGARGSSRGRTRRCLIRKAEGDLRAMLRRDRNHPSVVMWSHGNEIPQQSQAAGVEIAKKLAAICHERIRRGR